MSLSIKLTVNGQINDPPHRNFIEHLTAAVAREIKAVGGTVYGPVEIHRTERKRHIRSDDTFGEPIDSWEVILESHMAHLDLLKPRTKGD